jgi:hypothetical protein
LFVLQVNRYTEIRAYWTVYDIISPCVSKSCDYGPERTQAGALQALFYALFADDLVKTAAMCKDSENNLRISERTRRFIPQNHHLDLMSGNIMLMYLSVLRAAGTGEPTLETMFDVDVLRSWSTWLSGELVDEEEVGWSIPAESTTDKSSAQISRASRRNTKANLLSKSFISLRDKLSTIEAVSEYGTSSISTVVNEVCSIHGLEDWLVFRSFTLPDQNDSATLQFTDAPPEPQCSAVLALYMARLKCVGNSLSPNCTPLLVPRSLAA